MVREVRDDEGAIGPSRTGIVHEVRTPARIAADTAAPTPSGVETACVVRSQNLRLRLRTPKVFASMVLSRAGSRGYSLVL